MSWPQRPTKRRAAVGARYGSQFVRRLAKGVMIDRNAPVGKSVVTIPAEAALVKGVRCRE